MPAVSVLMPCYNSADTLEEALESLANQTFKDIEIVAVDDGSTDSTPEVLQRWSREDPRLRMLRQPHGGVISALDAGLKACRAPYIARMDSDDRSSPRRLERQVAFLHDNPHVAVVGCLVEAFPPDQVQQGLRIYLEWQNSLVDDDEIRREIFVESPLTHPSVIIRKEWLDRLGGYQEHGWAEDYDLWLRLYLAGARFAKVPQVLLEWRERPDRLTRADGRYSLENFLRAKAHYLVRGPLVGREAIILWGAGMMGRRLSKQLERHQIPLVAYVDVDPRKIGRSLRDHPILAPHELPSLWQRSPNPVVLAAVGARSARQLIRQQLAAIGLREGQDWWSVA